MLLFSEREKRYNRFESSMKAEAERVLEDYIEKYRYLNPNNLEYVTYQVSSALVAYIAPHFSDWASVGQFFRYCWLFQIPRSKHRYHTEPDDGSIVIRNNEYLNQRQLYLYMVGDEALTAKFKEDKVFHRPCFLELDEKNWEAHEQIYLKIFKVFFNSFCTFLVNYIYNSLSFNKDFREDIKQAINKFKVFKEALNFDEDNTWLSSDKLPHPDILFLNSPNTLSHRSLILPQ